MRDHLNNVDTVIDTVVTPGAQAVDADGTFPRAALDALGEAGILGLVSATAVGGGGQGMAAAADVVRRLATSCGSTAMIVLMHYAGTVAIENHGDEETRRAIAAGRHLTTLAFSETGSRSYFWAPLGTATASADSVRLDASKSWVTSAGQADSLVWSSRPLEADGPMTLWLVPAGLEGLTVGGPFDGFGRAGTARSRWSPTAW